MIRKLFVPIMLVIFLIPTAYCQPKIIVVGSSTADMGTIYNTGSHITKTFEIKNAGDQPLHINQVRTSCGCTAALLSDSLLKPGEKSEIKVNFNPQGYSGNVTKYIYVMSTDPSSQMTTLELKMNVAYALQSNPSFILFPNPKVGIPDTSAVTLTNNSSENFRITGVETNAKEISSKVDKGSLEAGESTRLQLYLVGEKAGPLYGEIVVHTSSKLQPTLAIRYYGGVNPK
jgi:hypothetical protein